MSASTMPNNDLRQVTLKSRDGRTVEVSARDAKFLERADKFVVKARRAANDPKRKKPRLRLK